MYVSCNSLECGRYIYIHIATLHVRVIKLPRTTLRSHLYTIRTKQHAAPAARTIHFYSSVAVLSTRTIHARALHIYCYCAANFVWHAINKQINWALNCLDAVYSLPRNYFSAKATEFFFFSTATFWLGLLWWVARRNNTLNAAQKFIELNCWLGASIYSYTRPSAEHIQIMRISSVIYYMFNMRWLVIVYFLVTFCPIINNKTPSPESLWVRYNWVVVSIKYFVINLLRPHYILYIHKILELIRKWSRNFTLIFC